MNPSRDERPPRPERIRRGRLNRDRGHRGEGQAEAWLVAQGYRVLERGFRTRRGEVDLVAMDGPVLCFVEVKTVTPGEDDIDGGERLVFAQRRRLAFAALEYVATHGLDECEARIDLVTVTGPEQAPAYELARDVFGLDDVLPDRYR